MKASGPQTNGREIVEISSPTKKVSSLSLITTLILFLSILVLLAITLGYLLGKNQSNQPQIDSKDQVVKITDKGDGISEYFDPNEKISLVYPSNWKAARKEKGPKGGVFETTTGSVEFWLIVDQPLTLSSEQKEGVEKFNKIEIEINKQKATGTEYLYKAGNYLTIVQLKAKGSQPQVTFWLKSKDQKTYQTSLDIVKSLTFTE